MKKKLMILTIFLFISSLSSAATWQQTLEQNFDIVDTFDELQDWKGTAWKDYNDNSIEIEPHPNDFPIKSSDGSPSIWTGYTHYGSNDAQDYWIQDHGYPDVWSGNKSMRMDMLGGLGGTQGYGPDRLITYFGNGSRNSGYNDMHVFFMVKIDPAQFPTYIDSSNNNLGHYNPGDNYAYFLWKFGGLAHGFVETSKHADSDAPAAGYLYGWHQLHFHLRRNSNNLSSIVPTIEGWYQGGGGDDDPGVNDWWSYHSNTPLLLGEWFGIELHLKLGAAGQDSGTYEMWIYNENGTEQLALSQNSIYLQHSKLAGDKFNKFWIGGNPSGTYSAGPGIVPEYYVDDFIIDDGSNGQIGPRYFALLSGQPICNDGDQRPCNTGNLGICGAGTQTCVNENWGACIQDNNPSTEDCTNTLDDDCDGDTGCSDADCSSDQYCLSQLTTQPFYSASGDGHVRKVASTWSSAHDAPAGDSTDNSNTKIYPMSSEWGEFGIHRVFLPIDTSSIPDDASITAATLYLYYSGFSSDMDNDGNDFLRVVQTAQANPNQLNVSDYPNIGTTAGSNDADIGNLVSGLNAFQLNAEGISWISKTGITKLGLREGHDILNDPIDIGNETLWAFYSSENSNNKPYLEITYTTSSSQNCTDGDGDNYGTGSDCLGSDCDDGNGTVHQTITCTDYNTCSQTPMCILSCPAPPTENCNDHIDNDCDGQTDENDTECQATPQGIIFEDNFDDHADWTKTQPDRSAHNNCYFNTQDCSNLVPSGTARWSGYYNQWTIWGASNNIFNSVYIDSTNYRGPSGKALTHYEEGKVGSGSWLSDYILTKHLVASSTGFSEVYVKFWMKYDPNYTWGTSAEMNNDPGDKIAYAFNGFQPCPVETPQCLPSNYNPYDMFITGPNKPETIIKMSKDTYDSGGGIPSNRVFSDFKMFSDGLSCKNNSILGRWENYGYATEWACEVAEFYTHDLPSQYLKAEYKDSTGTSYCTNKQQGCPDDGNWHSYQVRWKMNSANGVRDGEVEFWYDNEGGPGKLAQHWLQKTYLTHTIHASNPRKLFTVFNLGGNVNNEWDAQQTEVEHWISIDDLVISTQYIPDNYVIGSGTNQTCDADGDNLLSNNATCNGNDCDDSDPNILQCHPADTSIPYNCVDDTELITFIAAWKAKGTAITMPVLMGAIKIWKGCST